MVDDKEHLFDKDEYQRQIKKEMAKLNSQQFANAGPGGLGPEITTVGLKTNIEPISQKFLDVGFAIQDYGTIGFVSQNIDFDLLGAKYNKFDLNGDVTFGFLNFPLNRAEIFTVDITINTVTPPVIIWPASVKNLPINLPTADGSRYILHMAGYRNDNEEVYHVIGGSTGSILPAGTAENDHLEWDNTGLKWDAVQTSEYGATGPHADSGFLRFANDNIMLSQRNVGDSGNLEFKVTALNEFDFTNSVNSTDVDLVIRAQHATNPDAKFIIRQNFDNGASGDITTFFAPQSILLDVNASILMTIGPTEVDVQANLDMNLGNILSVTQIQGRDDGTTFVISFNAQGANDTRITDDSTDGDRINIVNNGTNSFLFTDDTGRTPNMFFFGPPASTESVISASNGVFEVASRVVPVDGVVNNDAMLFYADTATDPVRLLFKRKTVAGVASVGTFVYSPMDFDLDMGGNDITVIGSLVLNATSGHDIADTTFPFDEIHARKFLPSSATPTTNRPGFKRDSDVLYIDMVDATGTFEIRENGDLASGGFIFDNNGTASILTISNTSATLNLRDIVGDRATFVYDGNDLRIHADTGLSTQGIRLLTENADRIFITSTQILFSEPLNMNGLNISSVNDLTGFAGASNLGAGGNRWAQFHVDTIFGAGQTLSLTSSLAIFNIDAGDEFQVQVGSGSVELQVQTDTIVFNAEVITDSTMRFAERTAPTNVADTAFIYSKDVSTVTHMFVMDSDGNETDLTTGAEVFTWTADHDTNGNDLIFDADGDSRFEFGVDDQYTIFLGGNPEYIVQPTKIDFTTNAITWDATGFLHSISVSTTSLAVNTGVTTDTIFLQTGGGTRLSLTSTGSTFFGDLNVNTNNILNVDFQEFNERVGDPTVGANAGVIYVKDVSGNSRLFFDNNTEAPVELGAGGGSTFADNVFEVFDDVTATKKITFQLVNATGTNIFDIFGTTDTYTFPDGGGNVIMSQGIQTIGGAKTFTTNVSLNSGLRLNFDGGTSQTYITEDAADNLEFHVDTSDFFEFFAAEGDSNPIIRFESDGTFVFVPDGHEITTQGGSLDFGVEQTTHAFIFKVDVSATPEDTVRIEDDLFRIEGDAFQSLEMFSDTNASNGSSIAELVFFMNNSGGSKVNYAAIAGVVHIASTVLGDREGALHFLVTHGGSNSAIYVIEGGESNTTSRLGWYDKATNPAVQQTLASNPTTTQISTVLRNYGLTKL